MAAAKSSTPSQAQRSGKDESTFTCQLRFLASEDDAEDAQTESEEEEQLTEELIKERLLDCFSAYGVVMEIVANGKFSNRSGLFLVQMNRSSEALQAVEAFNGQSLQITSKTLAIV